jgi:hypothetical protein
MPEAQVLELPQHLQDKCAQPGFSFNRGLSQHYLSYAVEKILKADPEHAQANLTGPGLWCWLRRWFDFLTIVLTITRVARYIHFQLSSSRHMYYHYYYPCISSAADQFSSRIAMLLACTFLGLGPVKTEAPLYSYLFRTSAASES